jgi:hypothetical protein
MGGLWHVGERRKMRTEVWWTKLRGKGAFEKSRNSEGILLMWIFNQ